MNNRAKLLILGFALIIVLAFLLPISACGDEPAGLHQPNEITALGNITPEELCRVATNPDMDEIIVDYEGFTVSFNPVMHMPNWVSWTLSRDEIENSIFERQDNFRPDPDVPGCATLDDYYRSGFDRGHMAPAADMKWSATAMDESCLLTNICPQLHVLNNGAWKNLEEKCRSNATRDSLLVIVCGPVFTEGFSQYIGKTPVPVPPKFFKVILTPRSSGAPQAIGFIMPNDKVEGGMQSAAVSVDEIELLTGHDFFYLLPDEIENALEADNDFNRFSTGKRSRVTR